MAIYFDFNARMLIAKLIWWKYTSGFEIEYLPISPLNVFSNFM